MSPPRTLHLVRPAPELALDGLAGLSLTYEQVGHTRTDPPPGWHVDHGEITVTGQAAHWETARDALRAWKMFDIDWLELLTRPEPRRGADVVFASRVLGLWTVNTCRIVYVIDEPNRYGFAYGTTGGHPLRGEERFLLTRNESTGNLTLSIDQFSTPRHPLARLAGPITRMIQHRFVKHALAAFERAVTP